jgi:hypothetical protein
MNDNENDVNYYDTYWVNRFMSGVDVSSETQKQNEELSTEVAALKSK